MIGHSPRQTFYKLTITDT